MPKLARNRCLHWINALKLDFKLIVFRPDLVFESSNAYFHHALLISHIGNSIYHFGAARHLTLQFLKEILAPFLN